MRGGEGGGEDGGEGARVWQGEGEERSRSGSRVPGDSSASSQWVFVDSEVNRDRWINFEIPQAENVTSVVCFALVRPVDDKSGLFHCQSQKTATRCKETSTKRCLDAASGIMQSPQLTCQTRSEKLSHSPLEKVPQPIPTQHTVA